MKYFVNCLYYTSSDWHDWEEEYKSLSVAGNFLFEKDKALKLIVDDIKDYLAKFDGTTITEETLENLKPEETITLWENEDKPELMCDILTLKKEFDSSNNSDHYILYANGQVESDTHYWVTPATNPKYMPIREFACAPKIDAGGYRIECGYFDTYKEALEAMHTMPTAGTLDQGPYAFESIKIIIENEENILSPKNPVWEMESKLIDLRNKDKDRYYETFHPWMSKHIRNANI